MFEINWNKVKCINEYEALCKCIPPLYISYRYRKVQLIHSHLCWKQLSPNQIKTCMQLFCNHFLWDILQGDCGQTKVALWEWVGKTLNTVLVLPNTTLGRYTQYLLRSLSCRWNITANNTWKTMDSKGIQYVYSNGYTLLYSAVSQWSRLVVNLRNVVTQWTE